MRKIAIVGGETHIGEVTSLAGTRLEIVGATVRPDQREWAAATFECPVFDGITPLLEAARPDLVAVANENDLKAPATIQALEAGCDVIVDKPLALTEAEQRDIEAVLSSRPERRLLMLLTLRGHSEYAGLRREVQRGSIGTVAFLHVRMAVRLKRAERPPWFLDVKRSGGLFPDLLIHGLDQVEWLTGESIVAMTAVTGNLSSPAESNLRDHAAVFCELSNGATALVEGQRMLPDTVGSDYRVTVAGTLGVADLQMGHGVTVSSAAGAAVPMANLPEAASVVEDWLAAPDRETALVPQSASLRANRLALLASKASASNQRLTVPEMPKG